MFCFLCRTSVLHGRQTTTSSQSYKLFYMLHNDPVIFKLSTTLRFMSTTPDQQSFTVSYLINKFGFSPEFAMAASSHVNLKTPEKPDTVISFLEKHGFSKSQIKSLVRKDPSLLASDVEKSFLPKMEFFLSKGFSSPDLTRFLSSYPNVLRRSLERYIIPFFTVFSNLVHSDENIIKAIKRYPFLFSYDVNIINRSVLSNVNLLRDHGVPEPNIRKMLYQYPRAFLISPGSLKEIVEKVEETGLDPPTLKFVYAVCILARMCKSTLERKIDVYTKWGWSDKEIWECFRKNPSCMNTSEGKIAAILDFLVNRMGFQSLLIANQPGVLGRSLEKRIVPRALFFQDLFSKGLVKNFGLSTMFDTSEKVFLRRFIYRYEDKAPELLKLYKEKVDLAAGGKYRTQHS